MRKSFLGILGAAVILFAGWSEATAQIDTVKLDRFKQLHPRAKFFGTQFYDNDGFFEDVGTVNAIYGTTLSTGITPLESAWNHVDQLDGIYAHEVGELIPIVQASGNVIQGAMYDKTTETHRFSTFRFQQTVNGLPVFRSGIGFLVRNEPNNPVVVSGSNLKEMDGFQFVAPGDAVVTRAMRTNVLALMNEAQPPMRSLLKRQRALPLVTTEEENIIWAGVGNVEIEPELAVSFIAQRGSPETVPNFQKYLIIAAADDGEILHEETQIHEFDITGNVQGRATDGFSALECDPEVPFVMPYADIQLLGITTTNADANGNYVVANTTPNVTVRSFVAGTYFDVFDQGNGGTVPFIDQQVSDGATVNFLHNPSLNQEFPTANINAYVRANIVRDFVLSFEPNFPTIANQTGFDINTNIDSSCNATYSGSAINFYRNANGCDNTTIADVVYHEYGHHLINVTGNGQGQMGEGSGDTIGMLIEDEPILGNGFFANDCLNGIRNADNDKQYPCTGAIHDCGQLISGCVWSTRNELIVTEPQNYRDINAALFCGMLIVRGQMQPGSQTIDPFITILYLELDDDDADIGNGTPHYAEIAAGFGAHNMDAPPLNLIAIEFPSGLPELVNPAGQVEFTVVASGLLDEPSPGTGILHVDSGSGFQQFPMEESSPNVYLAEFPPTECGSQVRYYVSVQAANGQSQSNPASAPDSVFTALSATGTEIVFEDNFQTNTGWTVAGDAVEGQWNRAVPQGGGDRGDPANDSDGSGSCYLTDSADGNTDVDDGSTILTSPILDGTADGNSMAILSYSRWYSNTFGNAPEADVFIVDISNDGGSTWVRLETVGPAGAEVNGGWIAKSFLISDFVTPTDQIRLRFNASDLGDGSVVEAGIDAVKIQIIECDEPAVTPTGYTLERGSLVSGDIADTANSDGNLLVFERQLGLNRLNPISVVLESTVGNDNPSSLSFTVESSASLIGLRQAILLYNYTTDQFDQVSLDPVPTSNTSFTVSVNTNASDYVEAGTGKVEARLGYRPALNAVIRNQPWQIGIDFALWEVE